MKILFAADNHPYSAHAVEVLSQLAVNTWADVTMVGVVSDQQPPESRPGASLTQISDDPLIENLGKYRESFLKHWPDDNCPYVGDTFRYEWLPIQKGLWQQVLVAGAGKKDFAVRIRFGDPKVELLAAARVERSDLVLLGCTRGEQCIWTDAPNVPQTLVDGADCSILLVKEAQPVQDVYACVDESKISQESLEMINQVTTIHNAQLQVIGLTKEGGIKSEVYPWLDVVYEYYKQKGLKVTQRFVEISEFESFINNEVQEGLLALWLGKKSLLDRFFKKESLGHFIRSCRSSVLVLR